MDELEWEVKELKDDAMAVDGEVKNEVTQHLECLKKIHRMN